MRLYLSAKSKSHSGYTPDWLKVSYTEDGIDYDLILDIQGDIDYDPECLCCRCKGDLNPWVLWNSSTGEETDLYDVSEEEVDKMFPVIRLVDILHKGTEFVIGVYPVDDTGDYIDAEEDLYEGVGQCELWDGDTLHTIKIEFTVESNY